MGLVTTSKENKKRDRPGKLKKQQAPAKHDEVEVWKTCVREGRTKSKVLMSTTI